MITLELEIKPNLIGIKNPIIGGAEYFDLQGSQNHNFPLISYIIKIIFKRTIQFFNILVILFIEFLPKN